MRGPPRTAHVRLPPPRTIRRDGGGHSAQCADDVDRRDAADRPRATSITDDNDFRTPTPCWEPTSEAMKATSVNEMSVAATTVMTSTTMMASAAAVRGTRTDSVDHLHPPSIA